MRKSEKYQGPPSGYMFFPVAIETLGTFGPKSLGLLKELGRRIVAVSGEPKSTKYFCFSSYQWQFSGEIAYLYLVVYNNLLFFLC